MSYLDTWKPFLLVSFKWAQWCMSSTRNQQSLAFNEQHVSSFSCMARVQQPSSFVTAPWHLHSNTLFPLTPMHLLSVIPDFLMSSDPSLVPPAPFTPWTFPNSHASHMPQMSLTASLLQDLWLHSTFPTFLYFILYLAWQMIKKWQAVQHIWNEICAELVSQVLLSSESPVFPLVGSLANALVFYPAIDLQNTSGSLIFLRC